jgi:hypothetical protein
MNFLQVVTTCLDLHADGGAAYGSRLVFNEELESERE